MPCPKSVSILQCLNKELCVMNTVEYKERERVHAMKFID